MSNKAKIFVLATEYSFNIIPVVLPSKIKQKKKKIKKAFSEKGDIKLTLKMI